MRSIQPPSKRNVTFHSNTILISWDRNTWNVLRGYGLVELRSSDKDSRNWSRLRKIRIGRTGKSDSPLHANKTTTVGPLMDPFCRNIVLFNARSRRRITTGCIVHWAVSSTDDDSWTFVGASLHFTLISDSLFLYFTLNRRHGVSVCCALPLLSPIREVKAEPTVFGVNTATQDWILGVAFCWTFYVIFLNVTVDIFIRIWQFDGR